MKLKTRVIVDPEEIAASRGLGDGGRVQQFIDSEVIRLCEPYVPMRNKALIWSSKDTVIGTGRVIYDTPYARRWYYEPAKFNEAPRRGNYWYDRMMNEGGKEAILRGVAAICGGKVKK